MHMKIFKKIKFLTLLFFHHVYNYKAMSKLVCFPKLYHLLVFTIILKWQIFSNLISTFSFSGRQVDFVKTGNKIKLFNIYGAPYENFTVLLNYEFEDSLLAKWFMSMIPYLENNPREGVVSVNSFNSDLLIIV